MKHGEIKKKQIIDTALELWSGDPNKMTSRQIAKSLNMTHSAILYHFGNFKALRDVVAYEACKRENVKIIARLILENHPSIEKIIQSKRIRYLNAACR